MNKPSSTPKVCKKETKKVAGMETIKRQMDSLTEMVNDLQVIKMCTKSVIPIAVAYKEGFYLASNGVREFVCKRIKQLETRFAAKNHFSKIERSCKDTKYACSYTRFKTT